MSDTFSTRAAEAAALGELDLHLAGEGRHQRIYEHLGANVVDKGVRFAVWAPNARRVSVVGDWNRWDGRTDPLELVGSSGIWSATVPTATVGSHYKFELEGADGHLRLKADPYARAAEVPPDTASIVYASDFRWTDDDWLTRRAKPQRTCQVELQLGQLSEQAFVFREGKIGSTNKRTAAALVHPASGTGRATS